MFLGVPLTVRFLLKVPSQHAGYDGTGSDIEPSRACKQGHGESWGESWGQPWGESWGQPLKVN
jgi:hypothetical protein